MSDPRIQRLRDRGEVDQDIAYRTAELLALVLGHHHDTEGGDCAICEVPYPCQEAWHALSVLDQIDDGDE
jgi:hypothetical protein